MRDGRLNIPGTNGGAAPRVLHVVTSHVGIPLMRGQLSYLAKRGYEVFVASSPGRELEESVRLEQVGGIAVPMVRGNAPLKDLYSLFRLYRLMRKVRPAISNVSTPKAGLLGGLAAWLARVPCRVYTLRGLRWESGWGAQRRILMFVDWIACRCAHRVICVSPSVRDAAIAAGLLPPDRAVVFGAGGSNGVDQARFQPTEERLRKAAAIREGLGIEPDAPVIGFVGRLTRDKGVSELYQAHKSLRAEFPALKLMLLGNYEEEDPLPQLLREEIAADASVVCLGWVSDVSDFYQVFDLIALPSYREGFPNVVLEAHAAGKAVVGARATGTVDAIHDGINGLLVPVANPNALAEAIGRLLRDPNLAAKMGAAGRAHVVNWFRPELTWEALAEEYSRLLQAKGLPLPQANASPSDSLKTPQPLISSS